MVVLGSDGRLAGSVIELAQTLTHYNQDLQERTAEKERMSTILAEFKKHTAWQRQRKQLMRRNQERLFNESTWLETKTAEVRQDLLLVTNELRQVKSELAKVKADRDGSRVELTKLELEVKLEQDAAQTVLQICVQANKAVAAHAHERDRYRAEADGYRQQALTLKNRIEELAYQVNGLGHGI